MVVLAFAEKSVQLVPDGTLVLHVVVVLVMIAVLNLTLYRPLNRILSERDRETKGRLRGARSILASVEIKLSHYERSLREARATGYELIEQERASALSEREKKWGALKEEMRAWAAEQKAQIEEQTQGVRRELEVEAKRSGAEISSQILYGRSRGSDGSELSA